MAKPLTPGKPHMDPYPPQAPHNIPIEVCENIIDMLYSLWTEDTLKNITTLRNCALVCRDWRVRSQRMLFYKVQLSQTSSFYKFSAILNSGQHLRDYVHEVELTGYHLHTTTCIFTPFPAVFAHKLPKLKKIEVFSLLERFATWYPRTSDPPKFKSLPYMPLHSHFQLLLSSFTTVSSLYLEETTFRSFTEFARVLHALPNLDYLSCRSIHWTTSGGSHPNADLTKQPDWTAGRCVLPPFAPKLQNIRVRVQYIDHFGIVFTVFPAVRHGELWCESVDMHKGPLSNSVRNDDTSIAQHGGGSMRYVLLYVQIDINISGTNCGMLADVVDFSSCTGLHSLTLTLTEQFSPDRHTTLVTQLLASWKPRHSQLIILPYFHLLFTRHGFADVLHGLGTIIEAMVQGLQNPAPSGDLETQHTVQYQLCIRMYDWEAKKEWWSNHLDSCFPTWARLRQLRMDLSPRESHLVSLLSPCI